MLFGAAAVTFGKEFKYLQGEIGNTNSYTKIVNQGGEGQGGGLRIPTSPIEQNPDIAAADNEEDGGGGDGEGLRIAMLTVSANKMLDDPSKRYGEEKAIVTSPMSIDNKVRYCLHQGWDLVIGGVLGDHVPKEDVRGRQMEERSSRWLKIYHILRIFDNYDVIVWMDLDTLMTTSDINMVEYFDGDKDLHLTDDWGNWKRINSGVFGFRTTDWTRKFFEDVWMHNDGGKGVSDQRSINHVLEHRSEEERQAKVDILDRSIFNAFPRILEGENKYIVVGMVMPEVNVNLDGDANENSLVIHFAGAFAGCCNNSNRIPDGMLIQYVAMLIRFQSRYLSSFKADSPALDPPAGTTLGIGAPKAIRKASDVIDRMEKIKVEMLPAIEGGKETLNDKNITSTLRESLLYQISEFIP